MTSRATVSARLNQISFGRRVLRFRVQPRDHVGVVLFVVQFRIGRTTRVGRQDAQPTTAAAAAATGGPSVWTRKDSATDSRVAPEASSRFFSDRPIMYASTSTATIAAIMPGTIGMNRSFGETFNTVAARTVGPPQGTMFSTPFARQATTVSTTGLIPSLR